MLHSEKQLFTVVFSVKHAHYLLGVGDKAGGIAQLEAFDSYRN